MSLRTRVTLASAAAVAIAIIAATLAGYLLVRRDLHQQLDESVVSQARAVIRPGFPDHLDRYLPNPDETYLQVLDPNGEPVASLGGRTFPVDDEARRVAVGDIEQHLGDVSVDGHTVRVYTQAVNGGGAIQYGRSESELQDTLHQLTLTLILVALGGIILAGVLGRLIAAAAVRPVQNLSDAAAEIARTGDLSHHIEVHGRDELARLAASFNAMLDALGAVQRRERQLVADASHELRTPLTSLRTNIEVMQREHDPDPEDRAQLLADLTAQLEELSGLVSDLVDLARGDETAEAPETVRLDVLVAEVVARARRHRPSVEFRLDPLPCFVVGAPSRLDRAIANLVDNAAKWSPPGGPVEVRVAGGVVTVRDHGPGIAPEDLPFIFDRFYRSKAARSLPGSGLGLAIVRQVAETHGAVLSAGNAPDGGAVLELRIPEVQPAHGVAGADEHAS